MALIYLKIRAGAQKLNDDFISKRIRAILSETGTPADISGSMWHDYIISNIPKGQAPAVYSRLEKEPGFEPYLSRED
jgi:hypothetical protein